MNAIDFLLKEHNKVRSEFEDIHSKSHHFETKQKKFALLSDALIRHETMEHEVWYPYLISKFPDLLEHLVSEEKNAEKAIKKLNSLKTEETWNQYFSELKEKVEHHAKEEETKLFPKVKKILSEQELEEIGIKMYEFKKKYTM